jgi:hypothetical protein
MCIYASFTILALACLVEIPLTRSTAAPRKPAPKPKILELGVRDGEKQPSVPRRRIEIAKVDPLMQGHAISVAEEIDQLVEKNYTKYKVEPNALASDEVFVRRVYLDVTGTIPNYRQVRTFLASRDPKKRPALIDNLLNSPGYSSHTYNYWADILRLKDRIGENIIGQPYQEWVKECLEKNIPYDQWVYEMMSAEGRMWDNPATGYAIRDSGMPLDNINNTTRIFLGTQIGCAQCHNHPFDKWTQKEFYEMAAFVYGTTTRISPADKKRFNGQNVHTRLKEELTALDSQNTNLITKYRDFTQANLYNVTYTGAKIVLPHDYQYENGKPKQVVEPLSVFTHTKPAAGENPRITFAKWMTSPENPRFTKTITNRIWKRIFGVGQIEPCDDMRDDTVAENPEVMKLLEKEMKFLKYDTKEFLRVLLNTKTYQRESTSQELNLAEVYHFPGPVLRRMSPEEVWDTFCTLAVWNPDDYQAAPAKLRTQYMDVDLATASGKDIIDRYTKMNEAIKNDRTERNKPYSYKGQVLVRASELESPLPPGHFLRTFGQSDRDQIQANFLDGSVPQVLQMFNGPITHMLLEEGGLMYFNVVSQKTQNDCVDVIFLSILSRYPTSDERQAANDEIRVKGKAGYGNVIWALVNTREFMFVK